MSWKNVEKENLAEIPPKLIGLKVIKVYRLILRLTVTSRE